MSSITPRFSDFEWTLPVEGFVLDPVRHRSGPPLTGAGRFLFEGQVRFFRPVDGGERTYRPGEFAPALHRYFVALPATESAMLEFVNGYGLLEPGSNVLELMLRQHRELVLFAKTFDALPNTTAAAEIFNAHARAEAVVAIDADGSKGPALRVTPQSLLSYMWLKFADELTAGVVYRPCDQCGRAMELRSVKHQNEKRFCSGACRMAWKRAADAAHKGEAQ